MPALRVNSGTAKQKDRPKAVSLIEESPCLGRVAVLTRPPGGSGCATISVFESGDPQTGLIQPQSEVARNIKRTAASQSLPPASPQDSVSTAANVSQPPGKDAAGRC